MATDQPEDDEPGVADEESGPPPAPDIGFEVPEADAVEQALPVPDDFDDEDRR